MSVIIAMTLVILLFSLCVGWAVTFVIRAMDKGSIRWAWLLCKPFPLTEKNKKDLADYYQ